MRRVKRSSQETNYAAGLLALEIIVLDGIEVSDQHREVVEDAAINVCRRHLMDHADGQLRNMHQLNSELTADLIAAENRCKELTRRVNGLKKAVLDFQRTGNWEPCKRLIYGD